MLLTTSHAAAFSDLFVFGDSLSDVGNIDAIPLLGLPGPEYYEGRFSNGPVYSELLADALGLGPLTRSGAGGNNFAFGGAQTAGTGFFDGGLFINDLDEQVDDFISSRNPDPDALHIVWIGANDLLNGTTNFTIPIGVIGNEITNLYNDGARQFLVLNLPDLGATPRFNASPTDSATYSARTDEFNTQLNVTLDSLETSLLEIELQRFDVASVFDNLLTNPSAFGLTNIADAALDAGAANPGEYLFWDDVHPTAAVHAILADEIADFLLATPGDFNDDQFVDAADYTVWRDSSFDAAALVEWQSAFGTIPLSVTSASVPEPCSAALLGCCVVVAATGRLTRGSTYSTRCKPPPCSTRLRLAS